MDVSHGVQHVVDLVWNLFEGSICGNLSVSLVTLSKTIDAGQEWCTEWT